jgi:hypothetical protein
MKHFESIFIPFQNGHVVLDTKNKPRMYKSREAFEKHFPKDEYDIEGLELVEYAEVRNGDTKTDEVVR